MNGSIIVERPSLTSGDGPKPSFKLMYSDLVAAITTEMRSAGRSKQQINNRMSALGRYRKLCGCCDDARHVGSEFSDDFDERIFELTQAMLAEGKSERYVRDTVTHLLFWKGAWERLVRVDNLPQPFAECLSLLVKQSGLTMPQICAETRIALPSLTQWKGGSHLPSFANRGQLEALEACLRVPSGTLLSRLPPLRRAGNRRFTHGSSWTGPRTDFQKYMSKIKREKFRYKLVPTPALQAEWQHLCEFKTTDFLAERVQRNSVWKLAHKKSIGHRYTWAAEVGDMFCASADASWSHISAVLGVLALPVSEGGKGENPDKISTLAVLSDAERILAWAAWRRKRSNGHFHGGIQTLLAVVISLLRPETGYLWQYADPYADRFPDPEKVFGPSPEALTPQEKVVAWQNWCAHNHKRLRDVLREAKTNRKFSKHRDPKSPIAAIITASRPLDSLLDMIRQMESNIAPATNPVQRAIDLRDLLFMKLLVTNPLRVKHLAILTYDKARQGKHLYQTEDGSWRMAFVSHEFKNAHGAARKDYDVPIPRFVWPDIHRYLEEGRPNLAHAEDCNFFFLPSAAGKKELDDDDMKLFSSTISNRIRALTRLYMPDCPGFSAHAFRHIVARDYLKRNPGDYPNVAHLLHDKLETVLREYGDTEVEEGLRRHHANVEEYWARTSQ